MRNFHILLVDDDPFLLAGIGKDLAGEGYTVSTADSGERAIGLMEGTHFDLVITDLVMARIDGIQVLQTAKAKDPQTIVLILTGSGDMVRQSMPCAWMPMTTCANPATPMR